MLSFLVADMISDKLQETFPTQRCAAPWPLNCIEKRETRAYLQFTKADCYDIYIWCNQEAQHELQHLATLQQQSFATAVVCTCPYAGYVLSPVALQQLISLVLTKRFQLCFPKTVIQLTSGLNSCALNFLIPSLSRLSSPFWRSLFSPFFRNCCQVLRQKWIRSVNLK